MSTGGIFFHQNRKMRERGWQIHSKGGYLKEIRPKDLEIGGYYYIYLYKFFFSIVKCEFFLGFFGRHTTESILLSNLRESFFCVKKKHSYKCLRFHRFKHHLSRVLLKVILNLRHFSVMMFQTVMQWDAVPHPD